MLTDSLASYLNKYHQICTTFRTVKLFQITTPILIRVTKACNNSHLRDVDFFKSNSDGTTLANIDSHCEEHITRPIWFHFLYRMKSTTLHLLPILWKFW